MVNVIYVMWRNYNARKWIEYPVRILSVENYGRLKLFLFSIPKISIRYEYEVNGKVRLSTRLYFGFNIGAPKFKKKLDSLLDMYSNEIKIAYVNPDDEFEAVLIRKFDRTQMILFLASIQLGIIASIFFFQKYTINLDLLF